MINNLIILQSHSLQAHFNQAIEAQLLDLVSPTTAILYLWANERAVFVGKNQNAYTECNIEQLAADGGTLARRISGGGAVYHDKGNLNYTFYSHRSNYNAQQNYLVVLNALKSLGLNAQINGRNDIVIEDKKFSGNAFYLTSGACFHHGTILIDIDYASVQRYLSASTVKLRAKGVDSVRTRITNLKEFNPLLNSAMVASALRQSFVAQYERASLLELVPQDLFGASFSKWQAFFSDRKRILGDNVHYDVRLERRFSWGTADIRLRMAENVVQQAIIYTDELDVDSTQSREQALKGAHAYQCQNEYIEDILLALREELNKGIEADVIYEQ